MTPTKGTIRCPFAYDFTDELTDTNNSHFAQGAFSKVYKAKARGEIVVIKVARSRSCHEMVEKEYDIWSRMHHPNILPLEGICYFRSENVIPSFVSVFRENGRISDYVSDKPGFGLVHALERIALAIKYLHDNDIIHNDIRAANILVSDAGEPLLSDFGISGRVNGQVLGNPVSKAMNGNYRWMAYEFFKYSSKNESALRSRASDMWSFAMTIMEILTGKIPYAEYNDAQVHERIRNGKLPSFPTPRHESWKNLEKPISRICDLCRTLVPEYRLTAQEAALELRSTGLERRESDEGNKGEILVNGRSSGNSPTQTSKSSTKQGDTNTNPESIGREPRENWLRDSNNSYLPLVDSPKHIEPERSTSRWSSAHHHDTSRSDARAHHQTLTDSSSMNIEHSPRPNTSHQSNLSPESKPTPPHNVPFLSRAIPSSKDISPFSRVNVSKLQQSDANPLSPQITRPYEIPPSFWMEPGDISPSSELYNYLCRNDLVYRIRAEQKELYTGGNWYTKLYFDGELVGAGSGTRKKTSFAVAAKAALSKLRRILETDRSRYRYINSTRPTPADTIGFAERYEARGPSHSPTWTCRYFAGNKMISEGHGKTKKEAKQNALTHSSPPGTGNPEIGTLTRTWL